MADFGILHERENIFCTTNFYHFTYINLSDCNLSPERFLLGMWHDAGDLRSDIHKQRVKMSEAEIHLISFQIFKISICQTTKSNSAPSQIIHK